MEVAPQRGFYVSAGGTGSGGDLGGWGQHRPFLTPPGRCGGAFGVLGGCVEGEGEGPQSGGG